jgi:hypothetical protein
MRAALLFPVSSIRESSREGTKLLVAGSFPFEYTAYRVPYLRIPLQVPTKDRHSIYIYYMYLFYVRTIVFSGRVKDHEKTKNGTECWHLTILPISAIGYETHIY